MFAIAMHCEGAPPHSSATMIAAGITEAMGRGDRTNVFVHGVTSIGDLAGVNLNDDESHRALLFANRRDIVAVPSAVDSDFIGFLGEIGIAVSADRIVNASDGAEPSPTGSLAETLMSNPRALRQIGVLCGTSEVALNPFIATEVEWRLAAMLERILGRSLRVVGAAPDSVRRANMKHVTRERAAACGVPVAPAEMVRVAAAASRAGGEGKALRAAIERFMGVTGRVVVKGSFGASGSSTFIAETAGEIAGCVAAIMARDDNDIYIVEPLFEVASSPNVVMWIDPDSAEISCVSTNDQHVDHRLVFAGSTIPSAASLLPEMIEAARRLTGVLQAEEDFSGAAGYDFCEYDDPATGVRKFFLSELNARTNGGMYATALMERLNVAQQQRGLPPILALRSASMFTAPTTFAAIRDLCGELMFDAVRGSGVIPFNPGRLGAGKVTVACVGADPTGVDDLLVAVRACIS